MKPSTASLSTGALLAMVGLICVALPIDPAQPIEPASSPESNGNWLLFEHPDIAHQHHQQRSQSHSAPESELQVVREKRQASSKKKKTKPDKKKSFEKECLVAHNKWRKLHQAEPLVWDKKITEFSRKRANFIAESDGSQFKHPADLEYGENLAWHSRETTSCSDLIKMWYDEVEIYDFNKAKFDHETGHFTQLVWRSTRSVGCARAISTGPNGGVYLVCNYDPPGNFLGEELKNVLAAMEKVNSARAPSPPPPKPATTSTTVASTTTSTSTVAPTSGSAGPNEATSGSSSAAKKNKKNKKTDKNKRKKKGNKNKKNKKRRNKKKASTSTSTTTIATPTG